MNHDKKVLYTVSATFAAALLLVALIPTGTLSRILLSVLAVAAAVAISLLVKKRISLLIEYRSVAALVTVCALVAVMLHYLSGIRFGFWKTPFRTRYLWAYILPYLLIIISSEVIRRVLLAQKKRWVSVLTAVSLCLLDILMQLGADPTASYARFIEQVGLVILPAIMGSFLYHYLNLHYGPMAVIPYRAIITLYPYILPWAPKTPDLAVAFCMLVIPVLVRIFIHALYKRRRFVRSLRKQVLEKSCFAVLAIAMVALIMLFSCQFRYGLLVVASPSMTGEINQGDAIIYESYDGQKIEEGQVIVFHKNGSRIIHRVVEIVSINGTVRYYTKGDANPGNDVGFITEADIIGVIPLKIQYIGWPTLWLRELF